MGQYPKAKAGAGVTGRTLGKANLNADLVPASFFSLNCVGVCSQLSATNSGNRYFAADDDVPPEICEH